MSDRDKDQPPLSFKQMVHSVLAAALGVQSGKNRERDFTRGKPSHFILLGIAFTLVFMYVYDQVRSTDRRPPRQAVPRSNPPLSGRRAFRRMNSAPAPAKRPVYPALCAHAARRRALRPDVNRRQVRMMAKIARDYDKGYAHFSTRQNVQFNWPSWRVPDILAELATVQMHAIQTSGNCIRNTTTDQFAGVATTKSSIRAPGAKSSASGRPSTRNSPTCRASSRLRSMALRD
jgi:hypothetical protein